MIPFVTPPVYPSPIRQGRFASTMVLNSAAPSGSVRVSLNQCRVAILGLPDDTGVVLNNGRPGAAKGPDAFRAALTNYGVSEPSDWNWPIVFDAGNVTPAEGTGVAALTETHARVSAATRALLDFGLFPIAIGGGHDLTFPMVKAVIEHARTDGISITQGISFDAHLDVRDTPGSGMPFRRLIEDCGITSHTVHGLDPMANSREHVRWFGIHGGIIAPPHQNPPSLPLNLSHHSFVSFDLDVLDASIAPGVSALNPSGWSVDRAAAWLEALAQSPMVRCIDFMELSPPYDEDARTARVAARLFLHVLRGLARRPI